MLNKDELLKRTNNGLDVFKYYIDIPFKIGRNFLNPLYNNNKASCNIYFDRKNGIYRIKDFGNDEYSEDCFFWASSNNTPRSIIPISSASSVISDRI